MVIAALALTSLLLFAALAIDVGLVWSARTQSQNVSDAAALAAAFEMIQQTGSGTPDVRTDLAETAGASYAASNSTVANPTVVVRKSSDSTKPNVDGDFFFGQWNFVTQTLDPAPLNDPNRVTGVRVTVLMDDSVNKRSPTFLSRLIGRTGFDVKNTSVAYLGFEGSFDPNEFDLPVAIDSCKLSGDPDGCGSDFCATVANPPNSCGLKWSQGGAPTNVTCLDFAPTGTQNACWTRFRNDTSSVNANDLEPLIDSGNPNDVTAGDEAYLDNGTKDSALKHMRNRFYGCDLNNGQNCCVRSPGETGTCAPGTGDSPGAGGSTPRGVNRYTPDPASSPGNPAPTIDSWVVKLPVFDCQNQKCSGGGPIAIKGGVCFEIREILAPAGDYDDPSKLIKGRFLCADSPDASERVLFDTYCRDHSGPQDPGGCNYGGLRATRPVLVQ